MASIIIEPLISSVITVAISITRRAAVYGTKQAANLSDPESKPRLFIDDIVEKIEEDTQAILQALSSLQYSKLESARQYVQMAMDDLGFGDIHVDSDRSDRTDLISMKRLNRLMETAKADNLQRAMDQLKKADEWATEVFNDAKNCSAPIRIRAFDIRLFCAALLCWQDRKQWFVKWRRLFEFFFQDRDLATLVFCKQKFFSKFLTRQNGNAARNQMLRLIESFMNVVRDMVCDSYLEEISDFFSFLEDNTTRAKYLQHRELRWPFIWHLAYHDDRSMRALIPARYVLYRHGLYLFASGEKTIIISEGLDFLSLVAPDQIWAMDSNGRIVAVDAVSPENRKYINKDLTWDMMTCAELTNRVYAKSLQVTNHITVFDAVTGNVLEKEQIILPTIHRDFAFVAAPNGILFGYNVHKQERYILLPPSMLNKPGLDPDWEWNTTRTEPSGFSDPAELRSSFLNSKVLVLKNHTQSIGCILRISISFFETRTVFLETVSWTEDGLLATNLLFHDLKTSNVKLFTRQEVQLLELDTEQVYELETVWSANTDLIVLKLIFKICETGELSIVNRSCLDRMATDFSDKLTSRSFTVDERRVLIPSRYYDRPLALSAVKYYV